MASEQDPRQPTERDVLTAFEIENLPEHFKEGYANKRHNLFASVQLFRSLWNCFMLIDKIMLREFGDYETATAPEQLPPLVLYFNAHNKTRIALELGFSTSPAEAFSIMRDAVESAAFAHRLHSDPNLTRVWAEKENGESERDKFNEKFVHYRQTQLFNGLPELYSFWQQFSDIGAHTTLASVIQQFTIDETDEHVRWKFNYTGAHDARVLVGSLFVILLAVDSIEKTIFEDFRDRLKFDADLVGMRAQFERDKEVCRKELIQRYQILRFMTAMP